MLEFRGFSGFQVRVRSGEQEARCLYVTSIQQGHTLIQMRGDHIVACLYACMYVCVWMAGTSMSICVWMAGLPRGPNGPGELCRGCAARDTRCGLGLGLGWGMCSERYTVWVRVRVRVGDLQREIHGAG